ADLGAFALVDRVHQADLAVRGLHHHVVGHDLPAAEGLVVAVLRVDLDARQHVLVEVALLGRGGQCRFDRLEDHGLRHALLVGDRVHDQQKFLAHLFLTPRGTVCPPPPCWFVCPWGSSLPCPDAHRVPTCPAPDRKSVV